MDRRDIGVRPQADFSAFSPYRAWIGFDGSLVTPRACAASSAGSSISGRRASSAGLKKKGIEIRSSGAFGETTRWFVALR